MQRAVTGTALGQHSRLLSLLQPWASEAASLRLFGTSGSKVGCKQCQMQVFPAVYRQAVTVQLRTTPSRPRCAMQICNNGPGLQHGPYS